MGQQQLLLLVLGIVIVGLAVVTGIQSFEENRRKSRFDDMAAIATGVAAEVIAWREKPAALGGGAGTTDFSELSVEDLGYEVTSTDGGGYELASNTYYYIAIRGTNTASPQVRVRWKADANGTGEIIDLYLFGKEPGCMMPRRFWLSAWATTSQSDPVPSAPDGCSW